MKYQYTKLEEEIKNFFYNLWILTPSEFDMYHIANEMDVWIHYHDKESEVIKNTNGLYSIFLDERLAPEEQWQDFGHEFGHVIRHVGNQHKLRRMFRQLQENQANNFMYQFCVPTFMLLNYQITNYTNIYDGVEFICEKFKVTRPFARQRLIHFKNQMYMSKSNEQMNKYIESLYPKTNPDNWSDQTKALLRKLDRQLHSKREAGVKL